MYTEQRNDDNVLEGYVRDSDSAFIPIDTNNTEYQQVSKWIDSGGIAGVDPDILSKVKQLKRREYMVEGLKRIKQQVSAWDSFDKIEFIESIWNVLNTGSLNTPQNNAVSIFQYVKNTAIPNVNSKSTVSQVQDIDVPNDVNWPF